MLQRLPFACRLVKGYFEHVVDASLDDEGIFLFHHVAVQLSKVAGGDAPHEVVVVERQQQGVALQVVTGDDQALCQLTSVDIVQRKTAIARTVVVGNDVAGRLSNVE